MHQVRRRKEEDNMDEVFIRTWTLPEWLCNKYFKNIDYVSIEDLISIIEDLDSDKERLEEELDDLRQDIKDNYKYIGMREAIGYDEKTW
jgi:hypothetical protein